MADNPEQSQQQQEQHIVNQWQTMTNIIHTQIVEIRQEAINNEPPAEPWINLSTVGLQHLAIAGNNIAVRVSNANIAYTQLAENSYRVRARGVVYDDGGPERWMVENCFPTSSYFAMFSYGICGYSGPQAELLVNDQGRLLLVIDEQSAIALRNQSLNRADHRSQVYELIWSAYWLTIMSSNLYKLSDSNASDESILDLRQKIYVYADLCIEQLRCAIRSKDIYLKAIVVVEAMDRLVLVDPSPPFRKPVPPFSNVPAIALPNMQESVARITAFVAEINNSPMFTKDWQQMFDRFGNLQTSVPIVGKLNQIADELLAEQEVHLENGQMFSVKVSVGPLQDNQRTYYIESIAFFDSQQNRFHVWPVNDFEPFQVMRRITNYFLPLSSHGLAGSCTNITDAYCGNNGFQATTLNFPDVPQLNHRRLYFVNRAMAMELRALFEILPDQPVPVMAQYHQWFVQLLEMSRLVCDLRQWYRSVAGVVEEGDQWLADIQNCSQQLFATIPDQLFQKYMIISRLEQLWYHSILVPNVQALEPMVDRLKIPQSAYLGKKVDTKKRKSKEDKVEKLSSKSSSGLTGQKPKKIKKTIGQ